ncbi:MAG: 30S ribosomal protein S6 [Patescibacteria group bacterium]
MTKKIDIVEEAPTAAAEQLYLLSALVQNETSLKTIETLVSAKGKVAKAESLGVKTLAFPINKHRELTLVSVFFTTEPTAISALEKELKVEDEIERYLITTWRGDMNREMTSDRPRRDRVKPEARVETV